MYVLPVLLVFYLLVAWVATPVVLVLSLTQ
jgi:hypothetical protein